MLTRTRQLGMKIEASEGVEESLTAAEFAGNRKNIDGNPYSMLRIGQYMRDLTQASLTQLEGIPGDRLLVQKWTEEPVGGGAAVAAPWHAPLQGCGFSKTQLKAITVSVPLGTFRIGDVFGNNATQGSATATGIFIYRQTIGGNVKFVYLPVTGTFANADELTNYTRTGSGFVSGSPANAGYRFKFLSETDSAVPVSLTIEERVGGQRWTAIGARGNVEVGFKRNEPLLFTFEFNGCPVFDTNGITPRTGALITGITAHTTKPATARGLTLGLYDGATSYTPVLTETVMKAGNVLSPRPTAGPSLASSGYLATRISDRKPVLSIDPEHVPSGTWDWAGRFVAGTPFESESRIGSATDANGLIVLYAPRAQLTGDLQFNNRDGIQTIPNEAMLAGSNDDEFYLDHIFLS